MSRSGRHGGRAKQSQRKRPLSGDTSKPPGFGRNIEKRRGNERGRNRLRLGRLNRPKPAPRSARGFRKRLRYSAFSRQQPSTYRCHPNPMVRAQTRWRRCTEIRQWSRKTSASLFQLGRRDGHFGPRQRPGQPNDNCQLAGAKNKNARVGAVSTIQRDRATFLPYLEALLYTYCLVDLEETIGASRPTQHLYPVGYKTYIGKSLSTLPVG